MVWLPDTSAQSQGAFALTRATAHPVSTLHLLDWRGRESLDNGCETIVKRRYLAMKILGLDPATQITGWGFITTNSEGKVDSYQAGVIKATGDMAARLSKILTELEDGIKGMEPDEIAIEEGYVGSNPGTSLYIGYARGICYAAAGRAKIPIKGYRPSVVKKFVTSRGGASKLEVAQHVSLFLTGKWSDDMGAVSLDATDALAVAICHLAHQEQASILQRIDRP